MILGKKIFLNFWRRNNANYKSILSCTILTFIQIFCHIENKFINQFDDLVFPFSSLKYYEALNNFSQIQFFFFHLDTMLDYIFAMSSSILQSLAYRFWSERIYRRSHCRSKDVVLNNSDFYSRLHSCNLPDTHQKTHSVHS